MKDLLSKVILWAHNARGYAENNDMHKAKEILAESIQLADKINLPSNRAEVCAAIACASAKIGDSDQALSYLQKALQNTSRSTRETTIEVIGHLIPVVSHLGGTQLLSNVYTELQCVDKIFNIRGW